MAFLWSEVGVFLLLGPFLLLGTSSVESLLRPFSRLSENKGPVPIGRHSALCSPKPGVSGGLLNDSILRELLETGPGVAFSLPLSPLLPLNHSTGMVVGTSGKEPWAWPSAGSRV